jgi:hypothetical protein
MLNHKIKIIIDLFQKEFIIGKNSKYLNYIMHLSYNKVSNKVKKIDIKMFH